ncbi:PQQ-binding-like beta-propeller repeat protein [Streptomyces roseicoloratus]|uniref:PQQ-binding-like beta-propeller repeat protein n=1 Tax=Streptomyces roseicoloratus TaxID=2508722 RepID=A0ABY9S6B4_9ACTN|nr:PQQ-binding-like beta-propeller repeat protein [Streptomyces roseicoloratus]WMX48929.1 PQQ-binding-like beta-propeller repeat protein [Streptomyces roseicoloratus]
MTHDDPHRIGAYRLVARLGSGGMGTVYLARSATGRTAALKTMHARLATDPAVRTRFRLEVDAARVIGPVHGARVFDADPHAETPWLATEFVLGPPLDEAVALTGPLPEAAVRALGALLCAALAQLHASDVVHRDLKPSNIMITADGPKVIDFGIARAIGDDRLTRTGTAAGTPAFMSPEQATGQEHTPAGDVFALAGVLVHAATGHGPFGTGQHADLVYRVRYAEPDLTGVPPALLPVLARCLAKDPAARPTTGALAAELRAGQQGFAEHLPEPLLREIARRVAGVWHIPPHRLPPPPPDQHLAATAPGLGPAPGPAASRLSRRRLLTAGAGAFLGAAALGGGAWAWLGGGEPSDGPKGSGTPAPTASGTPALDLVWQVETSTIEPRTPPAPIVLNGLLVVDETDVKGLDPATGTAKWADPKPYFLREVTTDGTRLYAVDTYRDEKEPLSLVTVDPATGEYGDPFAELADVHAVSNVIQMLCATPRTVFLTACRGPASQGSSYRRDQSWFLLAVDIGSGRRLWQVPLPARPDGSERLHYLFARASGDHLVLVQQAADGGLRLVVHDAGTGRERWSMSLGDEQPEFVRALPAVDDRHVYPSTGELVALRLADGKRAWRFAGAVPRARFGPPAVQDGVVYAQEEGRGLVAVDAAGGTARWEERWEERGQPVTASDLAFPPAVGPERVYAYRSSATGVVAADLRTGALDRPLKAGRARYFVDASARRLIAVDSEYTAAYPLA